MKKHLRYLLFPFSIIYGLIIFFRNLMFDLKIFRSKKFEIPVIGIGNLSTGGTGKTPMAEYILRFLIDKGYKPALISRGYGRKTKGFLEVKPELNAELTGDEPYQVKIKFPAVVVAVSESRTEGIKTLLEKYPSVDVIVLDDSFQHRWVKPGYNILLTDYYKPYYSDLLIPMGMLREPVSARKRADVIVLTKSPEGVIYKTKSKVRQHLKIHEGQEVFFTSLDYHSLIKVRSENALPEIIDYNDLWMYKAVIFTGIANTQPLEVFLKNIGATYKLLKYPDHHYYSNEDFDIIINKWKAIHYDDKILITTEKDWRRIEGTEELQAFSNYPLYYLPISIRWNEKEKILFDQMLLNYVQSNRKGI